MSNPTKDGKSEEIEMIEELTRLIEERLEQIAREEEQLYEKGFLKKAGEFAGAAALGATLVLGNSRVPVSHRNSDHWDPRTSGEVYASDVEAAHQAPKMSAEVLMVEKGPTVSTWRDKSDNIIVGGPNDPWFTKRKDPGYNQKFIYLNIKIKSEDDHPFKIIGISAIDREIPGYPKSVERPIKFNHQMTHKGDWVAVTKQPPNSEAGIREIRVFTDRGVVTIPWNP